VVFAVVCAAEAVVGGVVEVVAGVWVVMRFVVVVVVCGEVLFVAPSITVSGEVAVVVDGVVSKSTVVSE